MSTAVLNDTAESDRLAAQMSLYKQPAMRYTFHVTHFEKDHA